MKKIKIASLQLKVYEDKYENIERLAELVADGAADGADIISLPEIWNSPYQTDLFPVNAEPEQGDSWLAMSTIARKNSVYIVGGSIPELGDDGRIYNTCYVFDREGRQIGKHRKVHLFDIYAHGEQVFKESDTLTAGSFFDTFETEWCKMAVNICFDIRLFGDLFIQRHPGLAICFTEFISGYGISGLMIAAVNGIELDSLQFVCQFFFCNISCLVLPVISKFRTRAYILTKII